MRYETKNITEIETGIIAHGVNCQCRMGSGVALAIRNKWPKAYDSYIAVPKEIQHKFLGTAMIVMVGEFEDENPLYVANCFTQLNYGRDNFKYASPDAISSSLEQCFIFGITKGLDLYIPKIGAGLGGLSWEIDVEPGILKLEDHYKTECTVCVL